MRTKVMGYGSRYIGHMLIIHGAAFGRISTRIEYYRLCMIQTWLLWALTNQDVVATDPGLGDRAMVMTCGSALATCEHI